MRVWLFSIIALILGISTGLGTTWLEFRSVNEYFGASSRTKAGEPPDSATPSGPLAVVVGGSKFDFGTLDQNQTQQKVFVVRNDGNKPLEVSWTGESCGMCIQGRDKFVPATIPPGEQCEVPVTFATKKPANNFNESVYLTTNDPRNSSLHLQITGFVTMAVKLDQESVGMTSVSASEPSTVGVKLFGFRSDQLEFVKYELSDPALRDLFEVTAKPLDAEALKAKEHAQAGLDIQIHIKPGLPIGPFSQTVTFTVRTNTEHTVELPVKGTVVGDLTVIGKGYESSTGTMTLGVIPRNVGLNAQFFVLAKGPSRNEIKLSVGELDSPDVMQVTIGEPTTVADGKAVKFPVNISIPKGLPVMNRLGNDQGKAAKIILETTHATSKQLTILLRFAIE